MLGIRDTPTWAWILLLILEICLLFLLEKYGMK